MTLDHDAVIIGGAFSGSPPSDADLMSAASLLDIGAYLVGLVMPVYRNPEREFLRFPFEGLGRHWFANLMRSYDRGLVALAWRHLAASSYGKRNAGWRELYDDFVRDIRLRKLIQKGLFRWWKREFITLQLIFASRKCVSTNSTATARPPQVDEV